MHVLSKQTPESPGARHHFLPEYLNKKKIDSLRMPYFLFR